MLGLAHRGFRMHDYRQHLLHPLRAAGYETALASVQHIWHGPEAARGIGFERELSKEEDAAGLEGALRFLGEARRDRPFYLELGFQETHRPFPKVSAAAARHVRSPAILPDAPATRTDMAAFIAAAAELDRKMGTVFAALDAAGLAPNTLVICTTDHGPAFPGMKCTLTDHGMGVMLILRGPGFGGGRVVDAMVTHLDLFPTVCDLAGVPHPAWLRGASLLPLVSGEKGELHEAVFGQINWHACEEPMRAVRTPRYKYIRRYSDRRPCHCANTDPGPSKDLLLTLAWHEHPRPQEELYDLAFDPEERHNLADRPEAIAILTEMRARLERWQRQTDDPLRRGPLVPPKGARICDCGARHGRETVREWDGERWVPLPR